MGQHTDLEKYKAIKDFDYEIKEIFKKYNDATTRENKIFNLLKSKNILFYYIKSLDSKNIGKINFVYQGYLFDLYVSYYKDDYNYVIFHKINGFSRNALFQALGIRTYKKSKTALSIYRRQQVVDVFMEK